MINKKQNNDLQNNESLTKITQERNELIAKKNKLGGIITVSMIVMHVLVQCSLYFFAPDKFNSGLTFVTLFSFYYAYVQLKKEFTIFSVFLLLIIGVFSFSAADVIVDHLVSNLIFEKDVIFLFANFILLFFGGGTILYFWTLISLNVRISKLNTLIVKHREVSKENLCVSAIEKLIKDKIIGCNNSPEEINKNAKLILTQVKQSYNI